MKYSTLLLSLFILSSVLHAQKQDHVWFMGYGGGAQSPPDDEFGNIIFDFNPIDRPDIQDAQEYDMNFDITNASICDPAGNLLFYTNGEVLYNHQHQRMENGDGLVEDPTGYGYYMGQGALILNKPGSSHLYYLIHTENYPSAGFGWKLFRTTVDMSANNGLGRVIEKRQLLVQDSLAFGRLGAVRHANGNDWWFFIRKLETNVLYRGLVQKTGITIDTVSVGLPVSEGGGQVTFSPDGRHYIVADDVSFTQPAAIHVYDVDRCSGTFSQQRTHYIDASPNYGIGVAVSPDSRYLYAFHTTVAYQYDLEAADIFSTEVLIGTFDGFVSGLYGTYFLYAQTAPDGRIYVSSWISTFHWHQVRFPTRNGLNCMFSQHDIEFPVYMNEGLPNHPNVRLGPIDGSACDTAGLDNHPLANFRWEQEDTSTLLDITFTDLSAYAPTSWHWDFGDGTSSQDTSPFHTYAQQGLYSVCLVVSNANSADTLCRLVNIGVSSTNDGQSDPFAVLAFPNPFSSTVHFGLEGLDFVRAQVQVFDPSGTRVATQAWSGRHLNWDLSGLRPGLYFYEIKTDRGVSKVGKLIKQ
ncbi:MAG: PKD domain-containing protein [Saprospiraceae bacterium]|nr:PKD domain-containing protein [Saprospiraceae bacterium]